MRATHDPEIDEVEVREALKALAPKVRQSLIKCKRLDRECERGLEAVETIPAEVNRLMAEALARFTALTELVERINFEGEE